MESENSRRNPSLSRRALITGAGIVAAGALGAGLAVSRPAPESSAVTPRPTSAAGSRTFRTTDLTVPAVSSWKTGTTAAGLVFVTQKVQGFTGLIMRESGEPVWIEPTQANVTDLRVQSYLGQPVLTYWTGTSTAGHGDGVGVVLDAAYRRIATVRGNGGVEADLHEFSLTHQGTALITAYETVPADLSGIGGAKHGYIYDCRVQEIDVATGRLLLDWKASDHVPLTETFLGLTQDEGHDGTTKGRAFDPYHLNAVEDDGDLLLVSARHTHTVYAIDRASGEISWRFGGKNSDIRLAEDAVFAWQHDVRRQADGTITLFDNHLYSGRDGRSRGMSFDLDADAKTATLLREYAYDDHLGTAMGSVQVLPGGNVLVGWGTDPAVTEFTAAGEAIYEATLGGISYRAWRGEWTGHPAEPPAVAAEREGDRVRVFASWNGATEVRSWRVLAGPGGALVPVGTVKRSGFETSMLVAPADRFSVQALGADGDVLGTSGTVSA
ncbi:arylsulfotransferase family protein [Leifsonia virtsii]|uniref:Arylsulfotransferase family protein n=1 Tax=Leifsonia virtsii TaxID=3035915 RepID=A0ABT8ITN1_9MICO|nr:arylsulfotransferase family protein [Leifsonia virtsii]MDN4596141.1 arylsulfotransferase family protein [Leifsonia virtsii]